MFLDNYFNNNINIKKISKSSTNFTSGYNFWLNFLFERCVRLFKWSNLPDTIENHELESILLMNGTAGITKKYNNTLYVYNGAYAGKPTVYFDIFEDYTVYSPLYSDTLKIGEDIIVGKNDSLHNSIYPLCHRYAMLLAHTDTSLAACLINSRDKTVPIASTEKQRVALENYRNAMANGNITTAVLDPAFVGVEFASIPNNGKDTLLEIMELRERLLNSFYNDIGVRTVRQKSENLITSEITGSDPMLLLNLTDMLDCRKKLADELNKKYNLNISVDKSDELKYKEGENYEDDKFKTAV